MEIHVLNNIHKVVKDNQSLLTSYMNDIKDYGGQEKLDILSKDLENVEKNLKLDKNMEPFRALIINILQAFLVTKTRIDSSDDVITQLLDDIDDKDACIRNLKNYIQQHQDLLKVNKISIPSYEPLSLSLQSTLKGKSAISKRLSILHNKDNSITVSKWLSEQQPNKLIEIPNKIMKKGAKEAGVSISVQKTEVNKIFKT